MKTNYNLNIKVSGPIYSGLAGGVGAFFMPAAAASCGGVLNVMGACAVGSLVSLPVTVLGAILSGVCFAKGQNSRNPALSFIGGCIGIATVASSYILAAKAGAAITGLSFMPVFTSLLLGSAIIALSALAVTLAGALCISACQSEPSSPRFARCA